MKIITLDGLKTFLDELLEKIGQEVYSKVESDARFATKGTEAKLQGVRFENASRPGRPLPIVMQVDSPLGVAINGGPLQGYVSNSDARKMYQPKGDYATLGELSQKANTADVYTKEQTDERFAPNGSYLDKATADNTYQKKGRYVTESGVRSLLGTFGYLTKNTADGYYQPKGQYLTKSDVYSGGEELKLPNGATIGVE